MLLLLHDGEAARRRVHGHHHGGLLSIGVVEVVKHAGIIVVEGDIDVQNHH